MNVHHAEPIRTARARAAYREWRGSSSEADRAAEIARLPLVAWKGRTLRTLRCCGTSGKGPHDVNVPEAVLWALIDPRRFLCPFHMNDRREDHHV